MLSCGCAGCQRSSSRSPGLGAAAAPAGGSLTLGLLLGGLALAAAMIALGRRGALPGGNASTPAPGLASTRSGAARRRACSSSPLRSGRAGWRLPRSRSRRPSRRSSVASAPAGGAPRAPSHAGRVGGRPRCWRSSTAPRVSPPARGDRRRPAGRRCCDDRSRGAAGAALGRALGAGSADADESAAGAAAARCGAMLVSASLAAWPRRSPPRTLATRCSGCSGRRVARAGARPPPGRACRRRPRDLNAAAAAVPCAVCRRLKSRGRSACPW